MIPINLKDVVVRPRREADRGAYVMSAAKLEALKRLSDVCNYAIATLPPDDEPTQKRDETERNSCVVSATKKESPKKLRDARDYAATTLPPDNKPTQKSETCTQPLVSSGRSTSRVQVHSLTELKVQLDRIFSKDVSNQKPRDCGRPELKKDMGTIEASRVSGSTRTHAFCREGEPNAKVAVVNISSVASPMVGRTL